MVVDLNEWKHSHPPIVRLMMAHQRFASAWYGLYCRLMYSVWRF